MDWPDPPSRVTTAIAWKNTLSIEIILASSSPYRKQLLERLRLEYRCLSPDIDEEIEPGEDARIYVRRLAHAKAEAIAQRHPGAIVIGSDQCAVRDGEILGKPGSHAAALRQLQQARGKMVTFHTGLCVMQLASEFEAIEDVPFSVEFRDLSDAQLEHYLRVEQPYDCAGSFKAEAYGICLFNRLQGDDPSALIGLPLIRLVALLERAGVEVV